MSAATVSITREIAALHRRAAYEGYTDAILVMIDALWGRWSESVHGT